MACSGHHGRLKECNLTRTLSVFFGLCLLSIDILPGSKWLHLQNFFRVRLCEKAWEISCQLVRAWDRLWNGETHGKVVRLHVKSGEKVPLAIIFVTPNILVIPFTKVKWVHCHIYCSNIWLWFQNKVQTRHLQARQWKKWGLFLAQKRTSRDCQNTLIGSCIVSSFVI